MRLLPRLPIHSRCYLARSLPRESLLVPRAERLAFKRDRGPTTRASVRGALLTYRLPPISYTRNIANRITDARARVYPRPNEIAFAYGADCPVPRVKDLARPWRTGPACRALCRRSRNAGKMQTRSENQASKSSFVITQGRSESSVIFLAVRIRLRHH